MIFRILLLLILPAAGLAQVIGYDPATGDPLDPAVIGAPPVPDPEAAPAKPKPGSSRNRRKKRKQTRPPVTSPAPRPKERAHLHGLPAPERAPEHAQQMEAMLQSSAGEASARRQRIQTLEAKLEAVRSELDTIRRGPHRSRNRRR